MKVITVAALLFAACTTQPTQPVPAATSASATQVAPSAEPPPPAPVASVEQPSVPATPAYETLALDEWSTLPGRWVGAEKGDAIPDGPLGGKIVEGGARVVFVKSRHGSKTPWNVIFWLPAPGHMSSTSISGGCGFYTSGTAFCRGYTESKLNDLSDVTHELRRKSEKTTIAFEMSTAGHLRMKIPMSESVISVELVRAK